MTPLIAIAKKEENIVMNPLATKYLLIHNKEEEKNSITPYKENDIEVEIISSKPTTKRMRGHQNRPPYVPGKKRK